MKTNKKLASWHTKGIKQILLLAVVAASVSGAHATGINTNVTDSLPLTNDSPTFIGNIAFPGTGTWNSSGKVGIGTASPQSLFHLSQSAGSLPSYGSAPNMIIQDNNTTSDWPTVSIIGGAAGGGSIDFGDVDDNNTGSIWYNHTDNKLNFGTNGVFERMVIDSNGLVGIGTTAPNEDLQLEDANADGWVSIYLEGGVGNHTTLELDKGSNSKSSTVRFLSDGIEDWRVGTPDIDETWSDTGKEFYIQNRVTNEVALFVDDTDNDISIGSTNPTAKLHIDTDSTPWMKFSTPTYGGDYGVIGSDAVEYFRIFAATGKALSLGSNGTAERVTLESNGDLYVNNSALCVDDGGNNCDDSARTAGTIYAVTTSVSGIDLAENYPTKDDNLQAGDIAMLDPENPVFVKKYDPSVENAVIIGIVSTNPGLLLGEFDSEEYEGARKVAIALAGRVPLKVTAENGPIAIGDRVAVSATAGSGMKADSKSEDIVGIALESFDGTADGTITVFALLEKNEQAEELCVRDTCVSEEQLKTLLELVSAEQE